MKQHVPIFWLCCIAFTVPLWLAPHPPLVDLPQHAAQVAMLRDFANPTLHYADVFRLNWFTPYLFGYLLTWLFALVVPVVTALKVVLSLSVIGVGVVGDTMNRALGGRAAWSYCLLPGLYSSGFYWGFFNFVVCLPLALALIWMTMRYAAAPSRRVGITLAVFGGSLVGGHVLAAAFCAGIGLVVTGLEARRQRTSLLAIWPFLAPIPIAAAWTWLTSAHEAQASQPTVWGNFSERLAELPADLTMLADRPLSIALAGLALATPFLLGARPRREATRWAPLLITVGIFLIVPTRIFGCEYVHNRFAVFVLPLLLLGLEPSPSPTRLPVGPIVAIGGAALSLALHSMAWLGFAHEARAADVVLAKIPPGRRVLSRMLDSNSDFLRLSAFRHYPQWYVAERGGYVDFSFATFYPELVRFRPETLPALPQGMTSDAGIASNDPTHRVAYDYQLIRGGEDVGPSLAAAGLSPFVVARSGPWWLLAARPPR